MSDDTKSIWVSTYELQVIKYGDNSKTKNKWALKAKRPGKYILGVTTDTGLTFKISYNVVK